MFCVAFICFLGVILVQGSPVEDMQTKPEDKLAFVGGHQTTVESKRPIAFSARLAQDTTIGDGAVLFGTVDTNLGETQDPNA